MIILRTNLELKLTFEKLIRTMKEPVEWNGQFVIVGDYLILQGRVRSLFFNFENRKVLTNMIDIPVKEDEIIEIENHTKVQNVLNLVLYAFGKWGMIRGIKVEQDYAQLNTLFTNILREFAVEPGYNRENFRFYRGGIRINYEDVIQYALDAEEEKAEQTEAESTESGGLWHKLVWKKHKASFLKKETTFEQRQKKRLGNNFYMVGYQCPKCRNYLHMVVFPEGKEFRVETAEGGVFLARAYTCNHCNCFYTPRPEKLLAEGDVYIMDFLNDTHAYEDYLELLGSKGDRVSNYKFNEYEAVRNRRKKMQIEEKKQGLEEICSHIETLNDRDFAELEARIEEGFYPAESVKRLEKAVQKESGARAGRKTSKEQIKRQSEEEERGNHIAGYRQTSHPGTKNAQGILTADVRNTAPGQATADIRNAASGQTPVNVQNTVKGISDSRNTARDNLASGQSITVAENFSSENGNSREVPISKTQRDAAAKRYEAKCGVLERLSPTQVAELKKELIREKKLYDTDKESFLAKIEEREQQQKREYVQKLVADARGQSYAKIQRIMQAIEKEELPEAEKAVVLEPLYIEKEKQANAEVASLMQSVSPNQDLKQFHTFMEQLQGYPEVDLSPYEPLLKEKQKQAESREISNMIRHARTTNRQDLTELMRRLKEQQFDETLLSPYLEKLEDKLRTMDENALAEICGNPTQMTAEEAMEAYRKVEEGIFLPELKTNALEMLKKRLIKLKTDECELLVHKLKDSLNGKIKENDRYHFYPARKVMMKEASPEELSVIDYALDTYGTKRGIFEYPILVIDTSRNQSGKEGMILTPEHLFYRTMLNAFMVPIGDIRKVRSQTGLLNAGITMELRDGTKIKLPYAVEKKELPVWGNCFSEFISYLQEKPDSRNVTYLASEKHETICCFRCGYTYKGGNICPKCGYKMNR